MSLKRAGIAGVGSYVPEKVLTNFDLEKIVETSDEWIRTRTGIRERRIVEPGTGTSELAARAAETAMRQAGVSPADIDLIICGTTTPDMPLPSCACLLQRRIGAVNAAAFDLAAACAGFVYSLVTAEQFVRTGAYRNVLVIGADLVSMFVDWTDRSTCVLFGDGAGAVVVREAARGGILSSVLGSDGRHAELLMVCGGGSKMPTSSQTVEAKEHKLKMVGSEVFKLAVRGMSDAVIQALAKAGVSKDRVACFIPHQANQRILDAVGDRLGFPKDKIFTNLDRYGNTSAASCVIALDEALKAGRVREGDIVVLATFGSGLVWGAAVLEW